ncbi:hypothetical protein B566_EDAN013650 [Ephemera danica]|nr:hypothetical protein B566_EDAN013650 [Ephemera danica]
MNSTLRLLVTMLMVACTLSLPTHHSNRLLEEEQEEIEARKAAESAHYNFKTDVEDGINDLTFHREETRDGLVTRGSSTVEELQKDGPVVNPSGTASVQSQLPSGENVKYVIQSVPADIL